MAFPWIFASNMESGVATTEWDSETDTVSQLDFAHYKTLALYPWKCAPYSGAYCLRCVLSGGTADAFVKEGDIDCAADTATWIKFDLWMSPNFTGTADDTFAIFEAQEVGNAPQVSFGARVVAATNVINLGIGKAAPTTFSALDFQRGVWHTVELKIDLDDGGSDDGTVDIYVTRSGDLVATKVYAAQVASLDQTAVTHGVLGIQDHLATTTGVILIDNFIQDDARVYPQARYQNDPIFAGITGGGHAFVGPGWIAGAAILAGTSPTMVLWDTDSADVLASQSYEVSMATASTNQSSIGGHIYFQKGCYVVLGGTAPVGQILLARSDFNPGVFGPLYYSDAGVRRLARGGA